VGNLDDALPTGTVTFLFTDIEGSTRLARDLGPDAWAGLLREHDALIDRSVADRRGVVVQHEGDGAFAAFHDPLAAVEAAVLISRGLGDLASSAGRPLALRMGLHSAVAQPTGDASGYVGVDVHYAARVAAAANGGQVVLSQATRDGLGAQLPADSSIVDEGFHPLRDFDEPRLLYRLVVPGVADDPRPLRSERLPSNLPEPVTTFVGRDQELAEVAALLETARILTLTGPGGTGKTRLAIAAGGAIRRRFRDGTWFVDLAPVRDPGLIPSAIAAALELARQVDRPIADAIRDHLRDRSLLLIVDNLEQLLPAAAGLIADLVRAAPALRVIVTSREVLRIAGEQQYAVPPLGGTDAFELFVQRARLVRPDFAVTPATRGDIEAIVDRLEGLPLAVELAAARIRLFPPSRILERLAQSLDLLSAGARDLPERQRTIRGAIAWSVDLLDDPERALFRRLAVFSGGWTADEAQAVADPDGAEIDAGSGLESLADKSLVRIAPTDHGEPRFTRHAFIREYASELLEAADERSTCERRHAAVFLGFAEDAEPHLMAEDAETWIDLIGHEIHNLRAAMRWSLDAGEPVVGLRIAAAIWRYWHQQAELREGRTWLAELLAAPGAADDLKVRILGLSAAGGLAYWARDYPEAWRLYDERLTLANHAGDPRILADAEYDVGFRYVVEQDPEALRAHESRALALYESVGDGDGAVRARQALVLGAFLGGDRKAARALELENLAAFRQSGSWYRTADSLTLLGSIALLDGDLDGADAAIREALTIVGPRALAGQIVGALGVAAHIALGRDEVQLGARLAGAAAGIATRREIANAMVEVLHLPDPVSTVRERLGADAEPLLAEGEALSMDEAVALAMAIPAARVAVRESDGSG
jgi:predicted ATPase/class 3 adenylate cyclase